VKSRGPIGKKKRGKKKRGTRLIIAHPSPMTHSEGREDEEKSCGFRLKKKAEEKKKKKRKQNNHHRKGTKGENSWIGSKIFGCATEMRREKRRITLETTHGEEKAKTAVPLTQLITDR